MKILIIGPDSLTELILVEALVAQLYKRHRCDIDLLIPENLHSLIARFPGIHKVFPLPQDRHSLKLHQSCLKLGISLRTQGYYQAINLQSQFAYSFIPFIAGIHRRTASYPNKRHYFPHIRLTNDHRFNPLLIQGQVYGRQLDHLLSLSCEPGSVLSEKVRPQLISHDAERQALLSRRHLEAGVKPLLVVCAGQDGSASKHWPANLFASIITEKMGAGWQVWLMGADEDKRFGAEMERLVNREEGAEFTNLTGALSLLETVDLLSLADAVLALDNGLMHMACALRRAVVALYGPSSPGYRPPLTKHFQVLTQGLACKPCGESICPRHLGVCLNYQRPELVLDALAKLPQPLFENQ